VSSSSKKNDPDLATPKVAEGLHNHPWWSLVTPAPEAAGRVPRAIVIFAVVILVILGADLVSKQWAFETVAGEPVWLPVFLAREAAQVNGDP
jgi:hypothetical protein